MDPNYAPEEPLLRQEECTMYDYWFKEMTKKWTKLSVKYINNWTL